MRSSKYVKRTAVRLATWLMSARISMSNGLAKQGASVRAQIKEVKKLMHRIHPDKVGIVVCGADRSQAGTTAGCARFLKRLRSK